ncbi:unnamed protein product [Parnassius mnemosyne]|uniref:Major facilitator superfamily (MFS) profile domain-containing protein n=1 Tax=Parnassius mnemosyne TaxID=213953 RepID=A0AAV1KAW0_9NEOP
MSVDTKVQNDGKIQFEAALDWAGFGPYSYVLTTLAGFITIAYMCVCYATTIIIPASACELGTTTSQQGYIASGPRFGEITGAIIGGYLGDKFGRRRVLLFALISSAVLNGIASISVNWVMLLIVQSLASFCSGSQCSLAITVLCESVPMCRRNVLVLWVLSMFFLSQGIMAVIAIPIIPLPFSFYLPGLGIYWNSWRTLLLVYSTPSLLAAVWLFFMQESPKYVFVKGHEEESIDIIKTIHRWNNWKPAEDFQIKSLTLDALDEPTSIKDQIVPLFKAPLLKYTVIMTTLCLLQLITAFGVWLPTIVNQFMQIVETGVGTDRSLCSIISDSVEVPVDPDVAPCALNVSSLLLVLSMGALRSFLNILLSLVVNRVGYRNMAICFTVVCGVSGIMVNLIPNAYASVVFFMIFMTGALVTGMYVALTVALFPTHLRALAVALTSTGGSIGMLASVPILNRLLEVNCSAGFYTFSSIFLSSAFIAAFLPNDSCLLKKKLEQIEKSTKDEKLTQCT